MTLATQQVTTMDERTLAALKASIAEWEHKLAEDDPRRIKLGPSSCPLCRIFNTVDIDFDERCGGCPVMMATKKQWCKSSPFVHAEAAIAHWHNRPGSDDAYDYWLAAAQAEIDFLRSLLPEEDQP